MNELFIPYAEALELKQLGLDEKGIGSYKTKTYSVFKEGEFYINPPTDENSINAPLYSQAFKWFRDTHNLDAWVEEINHGINNDKKQYIFQLPTKTSHFEKIKYFETYEQAELECLRELIEIVKEQKK